MVESPTAFVSYSYGKDESGKEHQDWVKKLVSHLKEDGRIKVIFDQDDTYAGDRLDNFMEREITNADMVIAICSQDYTEKANSGKGGVGYEKLILTKKIMDEKNIEDTMIIPVIRNNPTNSIPTCFGLRKYINFEEDSNFDSSMEELVASILRNRNQNEAVVNKEEMSWIEKDIRSARFEFFEFEGFKDIELTKNKLLTAIEDHFIYVSHSYAEHKYTMCNDTITAECVEGEQIIYLALEPETCGGYDVITAKKAFDLVFERLKRISNEKWIFATKKPGVIIAPLEVFVYGVKFRKDYSHKVDGIYEMWRNPLYDKSPWKVE